MKRYFFLFFFLSVFYCYGQKKMLFAEAYNSKDQAQFVKENKLEVAIIIYQQSFVKNNMVDENMLRSIIKKLIPDDAFSGYVVFDWEGTALAPFYNKKTGSRYNAFLNHYSTEFLKTLKIARSLRPNAQYSFYKIPGPSYKNPDIESVTANVMPVLKQLDFLCPSIYAKKLVDKENISNNYYYEENIKFALKIAKKINKPVFPFMWHRISPGGAKFPNAIIPIAQFKQEIHDVLSYSYQGVSCSGIIWWNGEQNDYSLRKKQGVKGARLTNVDGTNLTQKDFFQSYYNEISKLFR